MAATKSKKPAKKVLKKPLPAKTLPPQRKRKYTEEESYERHKERTASRQRVASAGKREIGPIPKIVDPERRAACVQDLELGLETYCADVFVVGW